MKSMKKFLVGLGLLAFSISAYANVGGGKELFKIVHNMATGRTLVQLNRQATRTPIAAIASTTAPSIKIKHVVENAILPGYFSNFSSQLVKTVDISQPGWPETFVAHFDKTKGFEGKFVTDFKKAVELLDQPVLNAMPVKEAFDNALAQATKGNGRGFFVLSEMGSNPLKPRDVFVLDLDNQNWISLNKSRGKAFSLDHSLLRPDVQQTTPLQHAVLNTRGVLLEVDDMTNPTQLKVSTDGVTWKTYSMQESTAQNLWAGWQEGFYMSYNRHTGAVLYAKGPQQPLFNSLQILKEIQDKL